MIAIAFGVQLSLFDLGFDPFLTQSLNCQFSWIKIQAIF